MWLYTVVPLEICLQGLDTGYADRYEELQIGSACLIVDPLGFRKARVVQLISPMPSHYLLPQFQPGRVIDLASER